MRHRVAQADTALPVERPCRSRWLVRYAWLWLVAGVIGLAAALPRPVAAQNPGCDRSALAGSRGPYWVQTRRVTVEGHQLELRFCAPHEHSIVAEQMLNLAEQALPQLDNATDVRLDGSHRRTFFMQDTRTLIVYDADGFIDSRTDAITLHQGSLESTVIHELAHYWADRQRFPERWMVEAYAEYLTSVVAPELGVPFEPMTPNPICDGVPLQSWLPNSGPAAVCAYAIGLQVLRDLAAEAGADTLQRVIGELSRRPGGVRSEALLTYLERESGANLSPLMRGRVFGPELDARLSERAGLRDRLIRAVGVAATSGVAMPPVVAEHLNAWNHQAAAAALEWIEPVLQEVSITRDRCIHLQLDCTVLWRDLAPTPTAWQALRERLSGAPQVLSVYAAIRDAAQALGMAVPAALSQQAARLEALPELIAAQETLEVAGRTEQRCIDARVSCPTTWRQAWAGGNVQAARGVLDNLNALLDTAAQLEPRCAKLGAQCSALWQHPLEQQGLEAAKVALASLEGMLERATALEAQCEARGVECIALWRRAFNHQGAGAAEQALADLEQLLDDAARVERQCERAGWPCARAWRDRLASAGPQAALETLHAQEQALNELVAIESDMSSSAFPRILPPAAPEDGSPTAAPLDEARRLFEAGEVQQARELVRTAQSERQERVRLWLIGVAAILVVLVAALGALLLIRLRQRAAGRKGSKP
ncbi:MAG: hypothetical protein SNJ69_03485 [Chloroflexaceae bacterium]